MRKARAIRPRPSPATAISLLALVIAMSGTGYAATGGTFILGKANHETSTASLTDSKGTPLALTATPARPPLTVSNSVRVPKLNASELDGRPATAFLPEGGTAANSSELGGQPASDYLTGTGQLATGTATIARGDSADMNIPGSVSRDYELGLLCDTNGTGTALAVIAATGATVEYWVLTPDGQNEVSDILPVGDSADIGGTTTAATWVVQVAIGPAMATTDWSVTVNSHTCTFAEQTITNS